MRWAFVFTAPAMLLAADLSSPLQKADAMHLIVNQAQEIVIPKPLQDILKQVGLKPKDGQIESLIASVQKTWLRKPSQERWQLPFMTIENGPALTENFRKLGMIDEIRPTKKIYDYALVLGCAVPRLKRRLSHLISLWNEGIRFKQIVFLTADRPLDSSYESRESLLCNTPENLPLAPLSDGEELPKTEAEAMAFYYRMGLLPPELKALPLQIVVAKTCEITSSAKMRPNRGDTVLSWFKYKPRPGSVLAISNQPHVGYEFSILRHVLPPSFSLDVVGERTIIEDNPAIFLDTIARWMFVEVCEFD